MRSPTAGAFRDILPFASLLRRPRIPPRHAKCRAPRSSALPKQPLRIVTFGAVSALRQVAVRLWRTAFRRRCLPGAGGIVASAAASDGYPAGTTLAEAGLAPAGRRTFARRT
jgi:hypothetical protein